jgi:hypothetical protein
MVPEVPLRNRSRKDALSLPPLNSACPGALDTSNWRPEARRSGSGQPELARYKHYDVQLDWCEVRLVCSFERHMYIPRF